MTNSMMEVDRNFNDFPIGFHGQLRFTMQGVKVKVLAVGGRVQVKAADALTPPEFGDRFLTIEDSPAVLMQVFFYPAVMGFAISATMDSSGIQPGMTSHMLYRGDYSNVGTDWGPIGNRKILAPGEVWADVYYMFNTPRVLYSANFSNARLGLLRITP